jgi:hypothetical protein
MKEPHMTDRKDRDNTGPAQDASTAGDTAAAAAADGDMVTLHVEIRAEHAKLLRRFAAREGASVEAMASLWLEEKLDEALRSSPSST